MSQPRARCQCTMASLSVLRQVAIAAAGSAGSSMFCRPSAMRTSFSWVMPAMPSPRVRMKYRLVCVQSRWTSDECLGLRGRQQLRVGLRDVVALHERRHRQLPVHRQPARLPPLDAQRLHLPGVVDGRERLEAVAQRRGVVVEVDPRAPAPELAPDRHAGADPPGSRLCSSNSSGSQHEGVVSVDAPAPAVERADEGAPIPVAFHQLYAAMAAGVVVGPDVLAVDADHDDRLVEDLVLDVVAGLGDLLESARHLPHPRPEQLVLQRVELRVVVPLLGDPVGGLHRPRHRKRSPVHIGSQRFLGWPSRSSPCSLIRSVTSGPANNVRGCASCRAFRSDPGAVPDRIRLCAGTCSRPDGLGSTR